ncbi:hypothetical protein BDP27DRAFT_996848 [Rhodocollybia butyracea]|uniref:Uncharacterized protein n=1 Tax=Rhodocollybia butyracea TaxID=206335 RepID=A0A9P5PMH2_9AGAR|nr:hypothetical protein BDP27DRAFT_996848 [Rhodocollybia butyracea]
MNSSQLDISIPSPSYPSCFSASSGTPSLVYSPMLSSSSIGDAELRTPILPRAELYTPDNLTATGQGEDSLFNDVIDGMGHDGSGDILMGLVEGRQDHGKTQDFSIAPLSAFLPALVAATVQPNNTTSSTTSQRGNVFGLHTACSETFSTVGSQLQQSGALETCAGEARAASGRGCESSYAVVGDYN